MKYEDVVGAVPTGDAPTTSEWSTILLPTKVPYIRDLTVYIYMFPKTALQELELSLPLLSMKYFKRPFTNMAAIMTT